MPDLKKLDWEDILLHGGVAFAVGMIAFAGALIWLWIGLSILVANCLFWLARETEQRVKKNQPMARLITEPQVLLEWAVPSVTALLGWGFAGALAVLL